MDLQLKSAYDAIKQIVLEHAFASRRSRLYIRIVCKKIRRKNGS